MIKLLIVDDDLIIRNTFQKIIDWESYGFLLCATVCNGQEALQTVRSEHIDIVITDIKMPVMDGLSFIEAAKAEFPDIKVVVLSAFDEFSLVNKAYQLGASDYLLKMELESNAVLKVLLKLSDDIKQKNALKMREKEKEEMLLRMEGKLQQNRQILQQKLLKEFVYGSYTKELAEKMQTENIHIDPDSSLLIVIKLNNYYAIEKELFAGERELFLYAVSNVFEELLGEYSDAYYFCNLPHEHVVVFSISQNISESQKLMEQSRFFSGLKRGIKECFGIVISGGVSKLQLEKNMIKASYQMALAACEYGFMIGAKQLINYADIRTKPGETKFDINEKVQILKDALKSMDGTNILKIVSKIKVDPAVVTIHNLSQIKDLFNMYYYEIFNSLEHYNYNQGAMELLDRYKAVLYDAGCLNDFNEWIEAVLTELSDSIDGSRVINKAKKFVREHYCEQILISDLAEHLQVSESHLSRVFKKDTGMSFTQYLTNTRIDVAISLMKNTNFKVYEIAEKVGYASAEHFSRMFKQVTGKTPKEYMK